MVIADQPFHTEILKLLNEQKAEIQELKADIKRLTSTTVRLFNDMKGGPALMDQRTSLPTGVQWPISSPAQLEAASTKIAEDPNFKDHVVSIIDMIG